MYFIFVNLVVLLLATLLFWWLSSYDSRLTHDDKAKDYTRRGLRCGISLFFVEISYICLWHYIEYRDPVAGMGYLLAAMPLLVIWLGCLTNLGAQCFTALYDPEDKRAFHPRTELFVLDGIAELIRTGKTDEAIRLCETLKASGEVNPVTLELTLEHLGVPQKGARILKPLAEADQLRSRKKFSEAELILHSLLLKNPRDFEAAMLLIRLYAQDLRQPTSARLVLHNLEKQPHVDAAHLDFARRSIDEWTNPTPKPPPIPESLPTGSVDELLAQGFIGTAIETLEEKIKARPEDFDLRMKLAETQALHCKNLALAEKIIRQLEARFSPEQIQFGRARLKEWREAPPG
jgi:hypothetical protein